MSSPRHSKTAPAKTEDSNSTAPTSEPNKAEESKPVTTNAEPLAPPPKPSQNNQNTPDYFSLSHEPNPFEQSFGQPGNAETPGKSLLPPVASLTSPQSLLPGATPGWSNSLRSGPLSPAMLSGPAGTNDYFGDTHFRGGFPTPNESSLRTGLTPGGGGSMFPAPSPGSQAFLNQLQSGGATPSTLDFHRTAMNARAQHQVTNNNQTTNATSNGITSTAPEQTNTATAMDPKLAPPVTQGQGPSSDPFGGNDANDAANGLYLLAQANGARNASNANANAQFAVPQQPMSQMQNQGQYQDSSPSMNKRSAKSSIGSMSGSGRATSEAGDFSESGQSEEQKPANTRNRSKKGSAASKAQANGNRRKAEETPSKAPANKKAKTIGDTYDEDCMSDDGGSVKLDGGEMIGKDGKKMTDEEKRKNFLERNRVAALKCRQRKKQWLANLQAKVELFSAENDTLSATVTQLREEIVQLKTLLLAHKDCPLGQAQNHSIAMNSFPNDINQHANPYGMAMQGQGMHPMGAPAQTQMAQRSQ